MGRVEIELPSVWHFKTSLSVRIYDINFGGHLAHDAVVSLLHEARAQFFKSHGWQELNIEGAGIIMADLAVSYKSEAFHGDPLLIQITARDFTSKGCDLVYLVTLETDAREVARAKTGIVFFDYKARTPVNVPASFLSIFQ
ncbi:MAG: thioesterase family protein [Spirochaetia bacterium]|nr:thioesterase family protein [Spirochaetia bacterium]